MDEPLIGEAAFLQALLDAVPMPLAYVDRAGTVRLANRCSAEWHGDEPTGRSLAELLGPDLYGEVQPHFRAALNGQAGVFELTLTEDGAGQRIECRFLPVVMPGESRVAGVFALYQDVSDRRLKEDHRRMLQRAVEASKDGILIADARKPDDPIVYANPAFESLTGYTIEEVLGRNCRFLQGTDRYQPGLETLRRGLADREPVQVLLRNYRKDGSAFWNELRIAPVGDERGQISHFIGVQTDVTARVVAMDRLQNRETQLQKRIAELEEAHARLAAQAEELARMAEELAAARDEAVFANRAKSEFVAVMSHELRTPLNSILGFSEMIADMRFGRDQMERYAGYAHDIHAAGELLLDLINDVLDLAKIESGKLQLEPEWVDPAAALSHAVRLVRHRAQQNGLELIYRAPSGLPRMWADERALIQIVFNLVSNAIKFTPTGGEIVIAAEAAGDGLRIRVSDSGEGIPPDQIDRILHPFERLNNRLDITRSGSGLGLALVRRLTDLHGGRMEMESEVGRGTRVTLTLPAAEPALPEVKPGEP